MPLYEYRCPDCAATDEVYAPMRDAALPRYCCGCRTEMARVYSAPTIKTTATFQAKNGGLGGAQFSDATRGHYLGAARAAGVNPEGKFYEGRVARFPGDPEAWVEGPDDIRRVVEARGWGCDGDLKVAPREAPPPPRCGPLADDIVEDLVEDRLAREYGEDFDRVAGPVVARVRDEVIEKHSPPAHLTGV